MSSSAASFQLNSFQQTKDDLLLMKDFALPTLEVLDADNTESYLLLCNMTRNESVPFENWRFTALSVNDFNVSMFRFISCRMMNLEQKRR